MQNPDGGHCAPPPKGFHNYIFESFCPLSVPAGGRPRSSGAAEDQAGRRRRRHLLPQLREALQRGGAAGAEQTLPHQMLRLQRYECPRVARLTSSRCCPAGGKSAAAPPACERACEQWVICDAVSGGGKASAFPACFRCFYTCDGVFWDHRAAQAPHQPQLWSTHSGCLVTRAEGSAGPGEAGGVHVHQMYTCLTPEPSLVLTGPPYRSQPSWLMVCMLTVPDLQRRRSQC